MLPTIRGVAGGRIIGAVSPYCFQLVLLLVGLFFFGGGVFTSSSEFYCLTLNWSSLAQCSWRGGGISRFKRLFMGFFPVSRGPMEGLQMLPQLPPSNGCGGSGTVIYLNGFKYRRHIDNRLNMGE